MAFTTKKSLLLKVQQGDEISWREFYNTYRPLVFLCGKDCGLTVDECTELMQLVMTEIFRKDILGKYDPNKVPDNINFQYDPSKGRFRHYFKGIVRNQALKLYHKRDAAQNNLEDIPEPIAEEKFDSIWQEEWKHHILSQALEELRSTVQPITYSAFELYALQERPLKEVAAFLNLSENSIYVAKNRCIATLKKLVEKLSGDEKP